MGPGPRASSSFHRLEGTWLPPRAHFLCSAIQVGGAAPSPGFWSFGVAPRTGHEAISNQILCKLKTPFLARIFFGACRRSRAGCTPQHLSPVHTSKLFSNAPSSIKPRVPFPHFKKSCAFWLKFNPHVPDLFTIKSLKYYCKGCLMSRKSFEVFLI